MADRPNYQSMRSRIAYHGHLAMTCLLDAEWSRRRTGEYCQPYCLVQEQSDSACEAYREQIIQQYNAFLESRTTSDNSQNGSPATAPAAMLPHFYQPMFYIPFGHADALTVTLLDDFDPLQHLTTSFKTAVEGIDVAFCPTRDSLGELGQPSAFCDLHNLMAEPCIPLKIPGITSTFRQRPFQDRLPLLVYTKYKMESVATVGYALLFQQVLLRAMATRVRKTLALLHDHRNDPSVVGLMSETDIDEVQCAMLDMQGEEEIATLIFCRNFSVGISLVSALRSLTVAELLDEDQDHLLERALRKSRAHNAVLKLSSAINNEPSPSTFDRLQANHVFRWTHSLLAASPRAFFDPEAPNCNGHVEAIGFFQLAPGHHALVESQATRVPQEHVPPPSLGRIHRYQVGIADLAIPFAPTMEESRLPLLPLKSVLSIVRDNLTKFGETSPALGVGKGRNVVDIATALTVPLPALGDEGQRDRRISICGRVEDEHRSPLQTVLPYVQKALCYPSELEQRSLPYTPGPRKGQMNLETFEKSLGQCGVPVELRRTILYLYQNFATSLADPFVFDSILDLYDAFATFHVTLTKHLPKYRALELSRSRDEWLPPLDPNRVQLINSMVSALHNALVHRVAKTYPESPIRDTAIDFRGGLTQILFASNASLLCSLGLLRKYVVATGPHKSPRNKVGGLTSISFTPGTRARWLNLGVEKPVQLALVECDVPHILHPPSYADYLHECAHLIFRSLGAQQMFGLSLSSMERSVMADRVHEIFANLLTYLILFVGDREAFLYNQILSYAKTRHSLKDSDPETIAQFSELIIRLFIVTDMVAPNTPRASWLEQQWRRFGDSDSIVMAEFKATLEVVSSFLPAYSRLWHGESSVGQRYCIGLFEQIYPKIAAYLGDIWSHAIYIVREFYHNDLHGEDSGPDPQVEVYDTVAKAMGEGRPLIRCLYEGPSSGKDDEDPDSRGFDSLALECAMLYQYIVRVKGAVGQEIHLHRNPRTGQPVYGKTLRPWHEFQVDRGCAAMFSPVPAARSDRLKREIAILKTFWDIAANLRSRRLNEILLDTWNGGNRPGSGGSDGVTGT